VPCLRSEPHPTSGSRYDLQGNRIWPGAARPYGIFASGCCSADRSLEPTCVCFPAPSPRCLAACRCRPDRLKAAIPTPGCAHKPTAGPVLLNPGNKPVLVTMNMLRSCLQRAAAPELLRFQRGHERSTSAGSHARRPNEQAVSEGCLETSKARLRSADPNHPGAGWTGKRMMGAAASGSASKRRRMYSSFFPFGDGGLKAQKPRLTDLTTISRRKGTEVISPRYALTALSTPEKNIRFCSRSHIQQAGSSRIGDEPTGRDRWFHQFQVMCECGKHALTGKRPAEPLGALT